MVISARVGLTDDATSMHYDGILMVSSFEPNDYMR